MRTMVSPAPILLSNLPALRLVCLARQFRPAHLATQPVLTPPLLAITGLCCGTRPLTRPRTVYTAPQLLPSLTALEPLHRQGWVGCYITLPHTPSFGRTEIRPPTLPSEASM